MNIGCNFYKKQIAAKARLPRLAKVVSVVDNVENDSGHSELYVFDPVKNKGFNTAQIFTRAEFDFKSRKFVPAKEKKSA